MRIPDASAPLTTARHGAPVRQPAGRTARVASSAGVLVLTVLLWCWSWVPQMLDLIYVGRQRPELGEVAERSAVAGTAYSIVIAGIALVSLWLIARALSFGATILTSTAGLLLAPWIALNGSYVATGGRIYEVVLFPMVVLAYALNREFLSETYSLLRRLVVVTALSSIVLGVAQPTLFLSDPSLSTSNEKALIGGLLLNGLLPTSNQLGILMAIGIPLIAVTTTSRLKWLMILVAATALMWSSSRTSLAAAAAVFVVGAVASRGGSPAARNLIRPAIVAAMALTVVLPFVTSNPEKFSRRAFIWQTSIDYVAQGHLLTGGGTLIFREVSPVTMSIGAITNTGHNMFVSVLTIGGLVAVGAVGALMVAYLSRALSVYETDRAPLVFLLVLCALSVLEDPLRGFVISPSSFVLIPLLAMPFAANELIGSRCAGWRSSAVQDGRKSRLPHA